MGKPDLELEAWQVPGAEGTKARTTTLVHTAQTWPSAAAGCQTCHTVAMWKALRQCRCGPGLCRHLTICNVGSCQELPGKNVATGLIQTPWHGSQASIYPPGPVCPTPIPLFSPQPSSPSTFPWLAFTPCCSLLLAAESVRCGGKYYFSCKVMLPPHTHTLTRAPTPTSHRWAFLWTSL